MLLETIRRVRGTLSLKLTLWYAVIFSLSSLLILFVSYFRISVMTMENINQELIEEYEELAAMYLKGGHDQFLEGLRMETEFEDPKEIFYRLLDSSGKVLITTDMQPWGKIEVPDMSFGELDKAEPFVIHTIALPGQSFQAQTISGLIGTSEIIQIGVSLEDNATYLQMLRGLILWLMAPLFLLAAFIGFLMARTALNGVEDVTQAAIEISKGSYDKRVETKTKSSEIQRLAQTFNMMLNRLEELMKSMREMTDNIAHDLRSPITRIRGIAEMTLLSKTSKHNYEEMAASTIEECDNLIGMIDTMLDISEAEAGVADIHIEDIDLNALIVDARELFRPIAEEKAVTINTNLPDAVRLRGDKYKLQRVVTNLLENSIKYTPAGGDVSINVVVGSSLIDIIVKDSGMGISEKDLPLIFDRFYRGDKSRSQSGIGLGLSQVKAFVNILGGTVNVISTPNKGSIFTISMPT